ncbi:GTPase domain-containing protein [Streptomyces sp. NPDC059979]|uniref:GTPase domain-containing protein n=1 Tax=Streptomyces sp. NPDC059979 TaxID=3347021 RepID=UPI0036B03C71
MEWFESARALASAFGAAEQQKALERAGRRYRAGAGFRGVVLGGPRRGKSTLLERLAEQGKPGEGGEQPEYGELVELSGPAAPDGGAQWTASDQDALFTADVAVLVIAATSPLSMDEKRELRFLRDTVGVPHIVVAVSRTDQVESEELDDLLDDIRDRVAEGDQGIPVFPMSAAPDIGSSMAALRELLALRRADPGLPGLRLRRLARQTCAVMAEMAALGSAAAAAEKRAEQDRSAARDELRDALDSRNTRIRGLQGRLEKSSLASARKIFATVQQQRRALATELRQNVASAQDPLAWWQDEFDDQLHARLAEASEQWAQALQDDMARVVGQLEESLTEYFPTEIGGVPVQFAQPHRPPVGHRREVRLPDLDHWRRLTVLVRPTVEGVARLVFAVLERRRGTESARGSGGSDTTLQKAVVDFAAASAAKFADKRIADQEARQRRIIADRVTQVVYHEIEDVADGLAALVRSAYEELQQELESARRSWLLAEERELATTTASPAPDWNELVQRAGELRAEIHAGIDGIGSGIGNGEPA